jgi:hypothetical protein
MANFAVLVPVGPGDQEVARAADLLESLWAHEPYVSWCVLIDDSVYDRQLGRNLSFPSACSGVSLINPRRGKGIGNLGGLCTGILAALSWVHTHTNATFTLKMDTDALVIAPFAKKIQDAFDRRPEIGMLGSYDQTCNGEERDFSGWAKNMKKLASSVSVWRTPFKPGRYVRFALWGRSATVRNHIRAALAQGYCPGENCLGGAYALSMEMINRMAIRGYLHDPLVWRDTPCGEDVMIGMYTRLVGMKCQGLVAQNQPFGLRWIGLPDTPERLLARGYSVIHSIKNDPHFSENEIRSFYRERRSNARD